MEQWLTWLIVALIGLVVGFIVHAVLKYSQGSNILVPILFGIIGAFIGAFFLEPNLALVTASRVAERFTWAAVGALVLSLIAELLFAGSRRGRVVTT